MSRRSLRRSEWHLASQVFLHTVPYGRVFITDALGLQDRPYTLNYMGLDGDDTYHVNAGPAGFEAMDVSSYHRALLMHELTHVWQSCHSAWAPAYIFNSVWHQVTSGGQAYQYSPGQDWQKYNVEQQAQIVQDWFEAGQMESHALFPYIRDHIRTAAPMR